MLKNVSEYQMSFDLGHSKSYIQSISSGRALPSMSEFISICEYLGVTPKEFFDDENSNPVLHGEVIEAISGISDRDAELILALVKKLK
ncbi:MAG: helix-turn-helix domain-containing protein [Clostridiales bacterium]|nr:helix-turn-helix domain-containing protein [Clostridiales bacterium]